MYMFWNIKAVVISHDLVRPGFPYYLAKSIDYWIEAKIFSYKLFLWLSFVVLESVHSTFWLSPFLSFLFMSTGIKNSCLTGHAWAHI